MAHAFTPGLRVTAQTTLIVRRELPIPGSLLAKQGDRVTSETTVARVELPGELHILRIAERMGIEPHEVVAGLTIQQGAKVTQNQVLCERAAVFGLFKSRFISEISGQVELISASNGHVAVRGASKPLEVAAHIAGTVESVEEGKAVIIRASGAFVQGIFGVGGERRGVIRLLSVSPSQSIQEGDIPEDVTGQVLVGGTCPSAAALHKAARLGATGFVTGAIDDQALSQYLGYELGIALTGDERVSMTVIITEGFGSLPIAERVLTILAPLQGRQASINGATQVRAGALRPEIFVSHDQKEPAVEVRASKGLEVGSSIRLIRYPYFGQLGKVSKLPHEAQEIETGAVTRVLTAKLDDGREVTVPRANAELL